MAKLSAHGRTELARLERHEDPARPAFQGDDTLTRTTFYALMSDGRILTRQTWTAPGYGAPRGGPAEAGGGYVGRPLRTGWRVHGRFKAPVEVSRARWLAVKLAQGFVVKRASIFIPTPAVKVAGVITYPHEALPGFHAP